MDTIFKYFLTVLLTLFLTQGAAAQKFASHAVKIGETLESIAEQYQVTPSEILGLNKEIRAGQALKPSTILVIPVNGKPSLVNSPATTKPAESGPQEEPIGFVSHLVKKKETLYGIAKKYGVSEDDIKKYNTQLYASTLAKKMVLRIPKFKKTAPVKTDINEDDYENYQVAAKETRWSIAHKFGITIDSLQALNPALLTSTDYLAEGQLLRLPKKATRGVEGQETQLYTSYTVPKGVGLFRISQDFGVDSKEIMELNPEIAEKGGLKEGMVIRLPQKKQNSGEINTENYNFYVVKPKQTEFSLTRKLGLGYKELLALNPELKNGLKAGMVLRLPKDQTADLEVRNALVLDRIDLFDSIKKENKPKIMFILPFRLDKADVGDPASAQKVIASRNDIKVSLGMYSGALIALDSITKLGISVDVRTFDNQLSAEKTQELLQTVNLTSYDAIVGPLDDASLKLVAARTVTLGVPIIVPTAKPNLGAANIFYSYTAEEVLRDKLLDFASKKRTGQNIIIIADNKNTHAKDLILARFPDAKVLRVVEESKNIGIDRDKLASLFSDKEENWVFVESEKYQLISSVTSILNALQNAVHDPAAGNLRSKLRMFTTNKNEAFDNDVISGAHLSNLNFTYPSVYGETSENGFTRAYQKRFGDTPDRFAVRGFDLTLDLLLKLAFKKDLMEVSKLIGETQYSANKFSFEKNLASGYFNQASYIMSYADMRLKEIED